jgi:hypothetical protein
MTTRQVVPGTMPRTVFMTDAEYAARFNTQPARLRWDVPALKSPGVWEGKPGSGKGQPNKLRGFHDLRKSERTAQL